MKPIAIEILKDYGYVLEARMEDYTFLTEWFSGDEAEKIRNRLLGRAD